MAKAQGTTKKIIKAEEAQAPEPSALEGNLQEALEETFPASDSISPYIKPAKATQKK